MEINNGMEMEIKFKPAFLVWSLQSTSCYYKLVLDLSFSISVLTF